MASRALSSKSVSFSTSFLALPFGHTNPTSRPTVSLTLAPAPRWGSCDLSLALVAPLLLQDPLPHSSREPPPCSLPSPAPPCPLRRGESSSSAPRRQLLRPFSVAARGYATPQAWPGMAPPHLTVPVPRCLALLNRAHTWPLPPRPASACRVLPTTGSLAALCTCRPPPDSEGPQLGSGCSAQAFTARKPSPCTGHRSGSRAVLSCSFSGMESGSQRHLNAFSVFPLVFLEAIWLVYISNAF